MTKQDPVFILTKDGLYWLQEVPVYPEKPGPMSHQEFFTEYYEDDLPAYNASLQRAKEQSIKVGNDDEITFWLCAETTSGEALEYDTPYTLRGRFDRQRGYQCKNTNDEWIDCTEDRYNFGIRWNDIHPDEKSKVRLLAFFSLLESKPKEESQEEPKDVIDFAVWYSGMERPKVINAYNRYQKEVLQCKPTQS
jgi:hypothetical protein